MVILESTDPAEVAKRLGADPQFFLEAIDESRLGVPGLVSLFLDSTHDPANFVVVRWAQSAHGLRHHAELSARRLVGLEDLLRAIPKDRGEIDLLLPFWASAAVNAVQPSPILGAEARYTLLKEHLAPSKASAQVIRVTELSVIRPRFRKLAEDCPAFVLSLKGALTSVAAATHLRSGFARIEVYTVEESRGRGFGRAAATALAAELLAVQVTPLFVVDLGDERAVRLVEAMGARQVRVRLKTRLKNQAVMDPGPGSPSFEGGGGDGLVRIGR